MRAKTSAVQAYCQVSGEKAKSAAATTPPVAPAPLAPTRPRTSRAHRHKSAAAPAPQAAVARFAHAAGVRAKKTAGIFRTPCMPIVKSG